MSAIDETNSKALLLEMAQRRVELADRAQREDSTQQGIEPASFTVGDLDGYALAICAVLIASAILYYRAPSLQVISFPRLALSAMSNWSMEEYSRHYNGKERERNEPSSAKLTIAH